MEENQLINKNAYILSQAPHPCFPNRYAIYNSLDITKHLTNPYVPAHQFLLRTVKVDMLQALIESLVFLQVRSSLFELAKKTKFNLCRHISVTVILLVIINLLVIFIPSMKDIFGVVGMAL